MRRGSCLYQMKCKRNSGLWYLKKTLMFSYQVRYNTFGELNKEKTNLLVVCHALTGNSRLDQWWGTMLGEIIAQLSVAKKMCSTSRIRTNPSRN